MIGEVFALWSFWINYWTLMYGVVTAICIGSIVFFTVICLLGKIWGSSRTGAILLELKKIRKQLEEMNK